MRICPSCSTENADDVTVCSRCHYNLTLVTDTAQSITPEDMLQASFKGPAVGEAAYPGAPEALQYGAHGYQLAAEIEQQQAPTQPQPQQHVAPRLMPGETIGFNRYRIERIVALGGMGAVYAAMDQHLQRRCAVKEMLDTFTEEKDRKEAVDWFRREASLLHDLNHPAIPRVRDWFEETGRYYLVMDFVTGRNLAEVLDQEGPQGLPEMRVRDWGIQICSVLSYLHHLNIIFRDLKPANVMVIVGASGREQIKLIDFGIARSLRAQNESTVIVTYGFSAPEQMHGQPEPRSDIYSLGATIHRLLTHHDPATNKPNVYDFPSVRALRSDITPGFEYIIMRAIAPRPADRWSTAGEMGRAISALPTITTPISRTSTTSMHISAPLPAISRSPSRALTNSEELLVYARTCLDQGRWQDARRYAQKAIDRDALNPQAHKIMGLIYATSRPPEPQRALAEYQEALRLDSQDSEIFRLIGDVYLFLLKQPNDAITEYQRALRVRPNDYETIRLLGMCYEQLDQLDIARQRYADAVRLAPQYVPAHMSYGQLSLRVDKLTEAERAFVEALRLNPALPIARHLLAQVYERQNRLVDALREAEYAVQVDPRDQDAQNTLQRLRRAARSNQRD
jgi:serine/threonine protein kinase